MKITYGLATFQLLNSHVASHDGVNTDDRNFKSAESSKQYWFCEENRYGMINSTIYYL